jgi:hypothetical protein
MAISSLPSLIPLAFMETPATAPAFASLQTGDYVIIDGNPQVNLVNSPEIEGGVGTIAMCVALCRP